MVTHSGPRCPGPHPGLLYLLCPLVCGVPSGGASPAPIRNVESPLLRKGMIPSTSLVRWDLTPPWAWGAPLGRAGGWGGAGAWGEGEKRSSAPCPWRSRSSTFWFCSPLHQGEIILYTPSLCQTQHPGVSELLF